MKRRVILIILDGFGISAQTHGNAISAAKMPNFNFLMDNYPKCLLSASSEEAGVSWGNTGNSEIGHVNIGSGRVMWHDMARIFRAIEDKSFFQNPVIVSACRQANQTNHALHLLGLVSDGGVHSHIEHLYALLEAAKKERVKRIYLHIITDGRDTAPRKILEYLPQLNNHLKKAGASVASVCGRYFAMDRDKRLDRTKKAFLCLTQGKGETALSAEKAITNAYQKNQSDEFITPTVIVNQQQQPLGLIQEGDSVIFFNFRPDRARQLTEMLVRNIKNLYFATMTDYEIPLPAIKPIFPLIPCPNTLPEVIANNGLKQLHIAETEKYAHITYFFAGGKEKPFPDEDRILIPSPKVPTYDLKPEMSAFKITAKLLTAISSRKYDFIVCNFANPDMVGHTGNFEATVRACEAVDQCLGKIKEAAFQNNYALIITADHGNAEQMINPATGEQWKEHSINPVPFIFATNDNKKDFSMTPAEKLDFYMQPPIGVLADIAPTILEIMGLKIPTEMSGMSLVNNLS